MIQHSDHRQENSSLPNSTHFQGQVKIEHLRRHSQQSIDIHALFIDVVR